LEMAAAVQGGQAMEMREQGAGLMDPRARGISPQAPQGSAPAAASTPGSQIPPTEPKSKKERKKLSKKTRPGSSGSER
jgi:chitin synthase